MVRGPKRPSIPGMVTEILPADRQDRGGFQSFLLIEWRQNTRQATGQQGFTRTGWADKQQVVTAGCSNFQRAFGMVLSAHIF